MTHSENERKIIDFTAYKNLRERRQQIQPRMPQQPRFNDLDEYALEILLSTMPDDLSDNATLPSEERFSIDPIELGKQDTIHVILDPEV